MTRLTIFDFIAIGCAIILSWLGAGFMYVIFNGNKAATLLPYAIGMGWVYKFTYDRTENVEPRDLVLVNLIFMGGFLVLAFNAFS